MLVAGTPVFVLLENPYLAERLILTTAILHETALYLRSCALSGSDVSPPGLSSLDGGEVGLRRRGESTVTDCLRLLAVTELQGPIEKYEDLFD